MSTQTLTVVNVGGGWQNIVTFDEITYQHSADTTVSFCQADLECLEAHWKNFRWGPCLVIPLESGCMLPHSDISELITLWLRTDDVLSPPFLKHVILWKDEDHKGHQANDACAKPNYPIQVQTEQVGESVSLESLNIERLTTIVIPKASTLAPPKPGPYLWQWGGFHSIYRLYEDKQKAFFSGIMQHGYGESFTEQRPTTHIPVPSRLYYPPPTNKLPLSGLRFGVKDIIDIAGLRTSVGSRSYYALYSAKESTAPAIQMLLSLGAVLVGKTKNTQFANGEDPQEWIDYSCPWNPRGDGYQNPDTSSSGSATAIASYDWLDFAVGSDTCGSISCPAAAQGLFSIRFSTSLLSRQGMFTISNHLDSSGFFSRTVDNLYLIGTSWLSAAQDLLKIGPQDVRSRPISLAGARTLRDHMPKTILYPWSSFPHDNAEVTEAVDGFLRAMEDFVKTQRKVIDLEDEWRGQNPSGSRLPMSKYFNQVNSPTKTSLPNSNVDRTTAHIHLAGFDDNTRAFRSDFLTKFGKAPYFDRVNSEKLKLTENLTMQDRKNMISQQKTFTEFIRNQIMGPAGSGTLETVMVWPFSPQEPQYRDDYPKLSPHVNWRWDVDYTAPLAGLPQVIVPIAEYRYHSRVTQARELLPVSVTIVGPEGSDCALLNFLQRFSHSGGLRGKVKTGRRAF